MVPRWTALLHESLPTDVKETERSGCCPNPELGSNVNCGLPKVITKHYSVWFIMSLLNLLF